MAERRGNPFPKGPLFGAIGFVAVAVVLIVLGDWTEIGTVRVETGAPVAIRDLRFADRADGTIAVIDNRLDAPIGMIAHGEDHFIRGTMRGLAYARKRQGISQHEPFRLIRWESRQVSLSDTATGQRIYLDAFGPTNVAAFARFLDQGR